MKNKHETATNQNLASIPTEKTGMAPGQEDLQARSTVRMSSFTQDRFACCDQLRRREDPD